MPRRRPGQVRADVHFRLRTDPTDVIRVSNLPGLSPHGRAVLAYLEHTRFWPGAAADALRIWERFVRSPYHRIHDYRYDEGCGIWECCPSLIEVQQILTTVEHNLPHRDARRLRRHLARLDNLW